MARSTVSIKIDRARLDRMLGRTTDEAARRAAETTARRAQANITRAGRVDTGRMRDSIRVVPQRRKHDRAEYAVGSSVPYARYQEEGIGPVVPRKAKVLRFKPKGSSTFVFAHRTRGFKGAHFLRNAWRSIRSRDFTGQ